MSRNSKTTKLADFAEIHPGYQSRGAVKDDPEGGYHILQIRDLDDSKTALKPKNQLTRISLGHAKAETLQGSDVIFLSKGHNPIALHLPEPPADTCLAGYFFLIRPQVDLVLPSYLAWFLNQTPAHQYFQRMSVGSHMPVINRNTLKNLTIPIPPLEIQRTIVEVATLTHRRNELLSELSQKQSQLTTTACLRAAES